MLVTRKEKQQKHRVDAIATCYCNKGSTALICVETQFVSADLEIIRN
jgi:hypothetical protein